MPNTRKFVNYSSQVVEGRLRARFYSHQHKRPRMAFIQTRQANKEDLQGRYPFAENLMGFQKLQPFVHDCKVTLTENNHEYKFVVFFKRHCKIPHNPCLQKLTNSSPIIHSDVVVVSVGIQAAFVNMKGRESALADWIVKRFVRNAKLKRKHLPTKLRYRK